MLPILVQSVRTLSAPLPQSCLHCSRRATTLAAHLLEFLNLRLTAKPVVSCVSVRCSCRPDASMDDASALNSAELLPVRSAAACIQLVLAPLPSGAAIRVRSAGGSSSSSAANKVLLPLPPGGASTAVDAASQKAGSRSASAGGSEQSSQYGSAAWREVVESQQAQGGKGPAGRKVGSAKVS
jgi:hypothetical protein